MLFIDSSVRLKYDRQLEHAWNQSVIQVLTRVPVWLACVCVCVHVGVHVCGWFRFSFKHLFFY